MIYQNPYPGSEYYKETDSPYFFGRAREIKEIYSLLLSSQLVILHAQSGAGKSSMLRAGLLPRLKKARLEVLPIARLNRADNTEESTNIFTYHVIHSLHSPMQIGEEWPDGKPWPEENKRPTEPPINMTLAEYLALKAEHAKDQFKDAQPRVLIIDQFEELFTLHRQHFDQIPTFLEQIRESIVSDRNLHILLAMRTDYLGYFDDIHYADPLRGLLNRRVRINYLRKDSALAAITKPMEKTGKTFEQIEIAEELYNKLATESNGTNLYVGEFIQPILLQLVCKDLWGELENSNSSIITKEFIDSYKIQDSLSKYYERCIISASLATIDQQNPTTPGTLRKFVHEDLAPNNRRVPYSPERGNDEIKIALQVMERKGLVVKEKRRNYELYELVHDQFLQIIRESVSTKRHLLPILGYQNLSKEYSFITDLLVDLQSTSPNSNQQLDIIPWGEEFLSELGITQDLNLSGLLIVSTDKEEQSINKFIKLAAEECRPIIVVGVTKNALRYQTEEYQTEFVDFSDLTTKTEDYRQKLQDIFSQLYNVEQTGKIYNREKLFNSRNSSKDLHSPSPYFSKGYELLLKSKESSSSPSIIAIVANERESETKNSLAAHLASNCAIRKRYKDGIHWIARSSGETYQSVVSKYIKSIVTKSVKQADREDSVKELIEAVWDKQVLLVLTDVKDAKDAKAIEHFVHSKGTYTILVTTITNHILNAEHVIEIIDSPSNTGTTSLPSSEPQESKAAEVLKQSARTLEGRVGENSDALLIARILLKYFSSKYYVLNSSVKEKGKAVTDVEANDELFKLLDKYTQQGDVLSYILFRDLVEHLGATYRYLRILTIFPKDVAIPEPTLKRVWSKELPLPNEELDKLLFWFKDLTLIQEDRESGMLSVYRVLYENISRYDDENRQNTKRDRERLRPYILTDLHYLAARAITTQSVATVRQELAEISAPPEDMKELKERFARSMLLIERANSISAALQTLYLGAVNQPNTHLLAERVESDLGNPHFKAINQEPLPQLDRSIYAVMPEQETGVRGVAIHEDGSQLVSGSDDGKVFLWDTHTGKQLRSFPGFRGYIVDCAFSSDHTKVVAAGVFEGIRIWSVETGEEFGQWTDLRPTCVRFSPNGKFLYVTDDDKRLLHLINLETKQVVETQMPGHTHLAVEASGKAVISTVGNQVYFWDSSITKEIFPPLPLPSQDTNSYDEVWGCTISRDGKRFAVGTSSGRILIGSMENGKFTGEPVSIPRIHSQDNLGVYACTFSANDKYLFTPTLNRSIHIWNSETGEQVKEISGHSNEIWACASSKNNLIVTASLDKTIKVWNADHIYDKPHSHKLRTWGLAISANGQIAASGSLDKTVIIWDAKTGHRLNKSDLRHDSGVTACVLSENGEQLFTFCVDGKMYSWDISNPQKPKRTQDPKRIKEKQEENITFDTYIKRTSVPHSGEEILAVTTDRRVLLLNNDLSIKKTFASGDEINDVAYSPNGKSFVSASNSNKIYIWDIDQSEQPKEIISFKSSVSSCAWSSDGEQIVVGLSDTTKGQYSVTVVKIGNRENTCSKLQHQSHIHRSIYKPESNDYFLSLEDNGALHLWDIKSNLAIASVNLDEALSNFVWYPDGKRIIVSGRHGVFFLAVDWRPGENKS